ncbi:MAG: hypothetical protein ACK4ZY_13945, partial [Sphingomonas sp.]
MGAAAVTGAVVRQLCPLCHGQQTGAWRRGAGDDGRAALRLLDNGERNGRINRMTDRSAGAFDPRFLRADGERTATANERVVMSLLSRRGAASRAELARATALAPHSVSRLIEPLIDRGLVEEGAPEIAGRGKPGAPLRLVPDAVFSVGISVMTDAVTLVVVDFGGTVRAHAAAPLDAADFGAGVRQIAALIAETTAEADLDPARRLGIGCGVTGYFVGDGARLNPPASLDSWALLPL